jgi:hypothetical protein
MKYWFMLMLAILLLPTPACTSITPFFPTSTAETLHFENDVVSFDYPAGTRIFAAGDPGFTPYPVGIPLGGDLAAGLAHPGWISRGTGLLNSSIGVFRHRLPPGSSLEQVMQKAYESVYLGNAVDDKSGPVTIAGLPGIQRSYRIASGPLWYTLRDIWIEKDESILRLSLWEESYQEDFQTLAELFLGSLQIKETLPPLPPEPTPEAIVSPTPYPAARLNPYDFNQVAFHYPNFMIVLKPGLTPLTCFPEINFGGERLVGLGDGRFLVKDVFYRSIQITRREMPAGSNLEAVMLAVYDQAKVKYPQEPSSLAATGAVSVAGQTGMQWAYRVTAGEPTYELRDVWLERDGQIYIVSIWTEYTNPDDYWGFQSGAQALLDSLVIK